VLAFAGTVLPLAAVAQEEQVGLARGAAVHPVVIEDLGGRPADLAPYVGGGHKPALFEFWATWCINCAALEPRMRAAFQRHGSQVDFVVVAVGVNQTRASVQRHVDAHPLPASRVLWDGNGGAVRAFDTPATSYVVLLDRQGKVAYTGIGPDQDLEAAIARATR
jgi:thiol-disulfide isomerase/thioredoxin